MVSSSQLCLAPSSHRVGCGIRIMDFLSVEKPKAIIGAGETKMSYFSGSEHPKEPAGSRFRALVTRGFLALPGAHNGLAALQAKAAGFDALYLGGSAMTGQMAIPDLGILTIDDVCFFVRQVAGASGLPVLVDGDTGQGDAIGTAQMVRAFEDAGAAAVHIEDQALPKKCGHMDDKTLVSPDVMAEKIATAAAARRHLYIIARTDAAASEGLDGAVARAKLYLEAGADAIFPEALISAEMFRAFAAQIEAPLLANMTEFGKTPVFTAAEFEEMGYCMVIWPSAAFRMAAKAQEKLYAALKRDGGSHKMLDQMQTRDELQALIGYDEIAQNEEVHRRV